MFAVLSAIDVSILAWLVKNHKTEEPILLIASLIAIIIVSFGIVVINKSVFKLLDRLRDL